MHNLHVLSSFAIILTKKRELIALLTRVTLRFCFLMSCYCKCPVALPHSAVVGLLFVILVFPDHNHLPFQVCATLTFYCDVFNLCDLSL